MRRWAGISGAAYGAHFKHDLLRRFFSDGAMGQMSAIALLFTLAWMNDRNAGYPVGGSKAIIDGIVERFLALGGHLRLSAKVEEILIANGAAVGVRMADGDTIMADWVASGADGHATIHELLGGRFRDQALDDRFAKAQSFPSYVQVSLGVAQDLADQPGFVSRVVDAPLELDPGTTLDTIGIRFFNFDPTFAPPGKTAVTCFLLTYNFAYWIDLRRDNPPRYAAEKQRVADAVIDVLERRLPGIRNRIDTTDIATPASVVRFIGNWKGSMEGWIMTPAAVFEPMRQKLPGLGRFLMVGQWVRPGGGLPTGLMTARAAVQAICHQDGLTFQPPEAVGRSRAGASHAASWKLGDRPR